MSHSLHKMKKNFTLTIGWLYPDLMSTYGDRGNIIVLTKRAEWRNISVKVKKIYVTSKPSELKECDIIFMGGAQDTQQEIVNKDLFENKGKPLIEKIENNIPGLFICGAYQFLGKFYRTAEGTDLPGLCLFPVSTINPGVNVKRLIGNILINHKGKTIVGFENHGGRTYLEDQSLAFATVTKGYGNNGEDNSEGILYKNAIGTYLHGPILPKNPDLADWILEKALEVKYDKKIELKDLDDTLAKKAKSVIVKRIQG